MTTEEKSPSEQDHFLFRASMRSEMTTTVIVMRGMVTVMMIDLPNTGTEPQQDALIMSTKVSEMSSMV